MDWMKGMSGDWLRVIRDLACSGRNCVSRFSGRNSSSINEMRCSKRPARLLTAPRPFIGLVGLVMIAPAQITVYLYSIPVLGQPGKDLMPDKLLPLKPCPATIQDVISTAST